MIKVEANCSSRMTDEMMRQVQGMGVEYLAANFIGDDASYDGVMRFQERAARYGLKIGNAGCPQLQKCPSIHLGKPDRDEWIDRYNEFTRALGKAGIGINYIAWQPNGIFRSRVDVGRYNHGQKSFICDMDEINARPIANDREYGEEEIWENFRYFCERALPVCEEAGVKLALHPNDPPVACLGGVHSLIYNTECYRRAFELVDQNPYLTMKMCIGCWLESDEFGNLAEDIKEFAAEDKISIVHFRNVSGTMPYFEETLLEDGKADMYSIMKQLVDCGFDGFLNIDHPFFEEDGRTMSEMSAAYFTGYMKALLHMAERKL
ncbi:MAG: mannonate dehydratase [Lachnospiraceae bacterium]|nr:mannonate dehydratase [Lachnospiraceae bacterium]